MDPRQKASGEQQSRTGGVKVAGFRLGSIIWFCIDGAENKGKMLDLDGGGLSRF